MPLHKHSKQILVQVTMSSTSSVVSFLKQLRIDKQRQYLKSPWMKDSFSRFQEFQTEPWQRISGGCPSRFSKVSSMDTTSFANSEPADEKQIFATKILIHKQTVFRYLDHLYHSQLSLIAPQIQQFSLCQNSRGRLLQDR